MSPPLQEEGGLGRASRQELAGPTPGGWQEVSLPGQAPDVAPKHPDKLLHPRHWPGLGRIIGFFCVVALLAFAANAMINFGLRRIRTSDFGVSNRVMTGKINAEVVITGSSRALTHYDCRVIQKITGHTSFNIGRNGSQTDMQLAYLKAYLANDAKPRLVVHNLDLFSFLTSQEIYDSAQYLPYLDQEAIYAGVSRVYPDAWKWKYLPLYGYLVEDMRFTWILGLKGFVGYQPKEDHFLGFLPRHTPWTGDFEKYRRDNPNGVRFEIEPQGIRDLEELTKVCRDQGIQVLFVYSPEYSEMQALERNRGEVFAKFRAIADRFQVRLWDYSDSPICKNRGNFYNSQHLNAEGAEAFSADLAKRLVESGLLSPTKAGTK